MFLKQRKKIVLVPLFAVVLTLTAIELSLRAFVQHSEVSYGSLFGVELPPVKVIPIGAPPRPNDTSPMDDLVVSGRKIARDDVWGRFRLDDLLGYAPKENSVSSNRWWQTNDIGARSRHQTAREIPTSKARILFFGDSYVQGHGLPEEDTFASFLGRENPRLDVINFGVEGYGLGQSFLRFQQVRRKIKYNLVLAVLIPKFDLWRDLNTIRYLGEGWQSYWVLPRFVVENGNLKLVKSPYSSGQDIFRKNHSSLSPELHDHLRKHDRFFVESYYGPRQFYAGSILFKLIVAAYWKFKVQALKDPSNMYDVQSEHLRLAKKIVSAFKESAEQDHAKFALVVFPAHEGEGGELSELLPGSSARKRWDEMISFLESGNTTVLDLLPKLQSMNYSLLDTAYDHSHLGPVGSKILSELIGEFLQERNLATK